MRILLWHGYLLRDSGSNIYTANLARSLRRIGHDVLLLCQERTREGLDFIDADGDLRGDFPFFDGDPSGGRCRLLRPWIGDLLPVYVYDEYVGFKVKTFVDIDDVELDHYTSRNVEALATAIRAHQPDAMIIGHEVMGPFIAREACEVTGSRYVANLHGSALEYAVKRQGRYREFARLGLGGAHRVVGGSNYMVREAAKIVPGWRERAAVVNPGCDIDLFQPAPRASDGAPTIGFVGKLIEAKGVQNLLMALMRLPRRPLRVVIVGDGSDAGAMRLLWSELSPGAPDISVEFTGSLEHRPLAKLLPTFDILAAPSVVPEAFGMVVAEAAACGVLPLVPSHSGIAEAGAQIEQALGRPGWLTFDADDPITSMAAGIERILDEPIATRLDLEKAANEFARAEWSWDAVASKLLAVATQS